eukprot:1190246-Prorocentrum_minimum.AAC.2
MAHDAYVPCYTIASFYGSSCANTGKGALDIPKTLMLMCLVSMLVLLLPLIMISYSYSYFSYPSCIHAACVPRAAGGAGVPAGGDGAPAVGDGAPAGGGGGGARAAAGAVGGFTGGARGRMRLSRFRDPAPAG